MAGKATNSVLRIRKAFTLIELLVVIAIISLLVSVLLPSLNQSKELARRAVCAGNLHSIALAMTMYAGDYDGHYPIPLVDKGMLMAHAMPAPTAEALAPYCGPVAPSGVDLPYNTWITSGSGTLWFCPSHPRYLRWARFPFHWVYSSYVYVGGLQEEVSERGLKYDPGHKRPTGLAYDAESGRGLIVADLIGQGNSPPFYVTTNHPRRGGWQSGPTLRPPGMNRGWNDGSVWWTEFDELMPEIGLDAKELEGVPLSRPDCSYSHYQNAYWW